MAASTSVANVSAIVSTAVQPKVYNGAGKPISKGAGERVRHPERSARKVNQVFSRRQDANQEEALTETLGSLKISDPSPVIDFDDMHLKPELLKGIFAHGMQRPAICQQSVIMPMISGRDVICQAQSGMGKTAAFCISILQRLNVNDPTSKALVLAPTRELARQILDEFRAFAKFMDIKCIPCIGGTGRLWKNVEAVTSGNFHVAVGTLGRISHLLRQKFENESGVKVQALNGDAIKILVIDEADKMIMQAEQQDLQQVFYSISPKAQVIVTSATMPSVAFDRCREVMKKSVFTFLLPPEEQTLQGIRQFHVKVGNQEAGKLATLDELFPFLKEKRGIVFCNSRIRAERLNTQMQARNHTIAEMTGNMEQSQRFTRFQDFKSGRIPVLISSDLLGRGVDVHQVQLVVNYDMPDSGRKEEYIHRIGRAGRYGKKGVAVSFVKDNEVDKIKELEEFFRTEIPELRASIGDLMAELN